MEFVKDIKQVLVLGLTLGIAIIIGAKIMATPPQPAQISVTGEAKTESLPQIASFNATVSEFNANKDTAVNTVNAKMAVLVTAIKDFGIAETDITTQQVSVYETGGGPEIMIYPPRPGQVQPGWQASNSIEVVLRDVNRAGELTDLLQSSGATGVSGPNFSIEDTTDIDAKLLKEAIEDARNKAQITASAAGRRLGKVINVSEFDSVPYYQAKAMGGVDTGVPTPIEPGTQTTKKQVNVLFELK